ncbi:ABC transporter permease [Actinophytocola sp.]|uniref:ABC transporter permease n=1 Tax=Actinophytocola sp. TaxID=1872138 RepID=UPI003D6B28C2
MQTDVVVPSPAAPPREPGVPGTATGRVVGRGARAVLRYAPLLVVGAILAYLVLAPLAVLLWSSFKPGGVIDSAGLTLANYLEVYSRPRIYRMLGNTIVFAVGSTVFAVVVGAALAWLFERTDLPSRRFLRSFIVVPLAMPPVLLGVAWVLLLDPTIGVINSGLGLLSIGPLDIYSMWGMIFLEGVAFVPTTYLMLAPAFRNIDSSLEEAALTSGAGTWMLLRRVLIPLVTPSLLAVSSFLFIASFLLFDIPGLIGLRGGIHVLASEIYVASQPQAGFPEYGEIGALAGIPLIMLLMLTWAYHFFVRRSYRYVVVSGKARHRRLFRLGRWRTPCVIVVWVYFLCAIIGPTLALAAVSFFPYYTGISRDALAGLTFANYGELLSSPTMLSGAWHTLVVAVVTATFLMFFAPLVSWVVTKTRLRGRGVVDALAFMPIGIPAVMIGVALIFLYLQLPSVPIYATIWIIAIAHITTFTSFATRTTNGAVMQIAPELEEAARTSGATRAAAFRRVILPLVRPAMLIVFVWVAAHSIRELSSALLLQGTDNETVPTVLWGYWENGEPTVTAAGGVLLIAVLAVLVFAWSRVRKEDGEY